MTTAALGGLGAAAGAIMGAFGNQGRSLTAAPQPRQDTSTQALVLARDRHAARQALRNAREERLYALLTDPHFAGFLGAVGGLWLSAHLPFSEDEAKNARLQALAGASSVLIGLGRAGVGDLTTLMAAGAALGAMGISSGGGASGAGIGGAVGGGGLGSTLGLLGPAGLLQTVPALWDWLT